MALELCENGDVFDYICYTGLFEQPTARYHLKALLEGLGNAHNAGISHRDMKIENVFVNSEFDFKIGDFGFATIKSVSETY